MRFNSTRLRWLFLLGAVALNALFALHFMGDPLGQAPVLDARENLSWATTLAEGTLPEEPFYRALLYPWVLALFSGAGGVSPLVATAVGVLCHGISALLVGLIARQVWRNRAAAWLAGGLYAIYPVAMWFSVQALDMSFSTMLFLVAVRCFLRARDAAEFSRSNAWLWWGGCGLFGGLAVLARPNFLPPVLVLVGLPVVCAWIQARSENGVQMALRSALVSSLIVGAVLSAVLVAQGLINQRVGGEFRILPWQGAYNLYAANREGANGKFYMQRVNFDAVPAGANTTRMESDLLYREAQGEAADPSVSAMNAYWKGELREAITNDPLRWFGLMGRKVVYLFNDWEQYNNLTYGFHQERFALLRWNPLGWGVLLIGATLGLVLGYRQASRANLWGLVCLGGAYAAGLLLFFVSARFRLPLAPLLAVACGGLVCVQWRQLAGRKAWLAAGIMVFGAVGVSGNWFNARDRETFKQDNLLLANAALQVGDDARAATYAGRAIELDPQMEAAKRIFVAAHFNLWLQAEGAAADQSWSEIVSTIGRIEQHDASSRFIQGFVRWRSGESDAARRIWKAAVDRFGSEAASSAAALEWVDAKPGASISDAAAGMRFLFER